MTGVMVGEGEKTFLELVRYYVDGVGTLSEIPGIAYREGEEIHHNGWRELTDLSEIPLYMNIWRTLRTRLFIMRAAGDVLFPAVIVFLLLIRSSGSVILT